MADAKIAQLYDDAAKQEMDRHGIQLADFRRSLTIDTDLQWRARRQLHFSRRRILHEVNKVSPAFAAKLRGLGRPRVEPAA
jgi:hypothetical protein